MNDWISKKIFQGLEGKLIYIEIPKIIKVLKILKLSEPNTCLINEMYNILFKRREKLFEFLIEDLEKGMLPKLNQKYIICVQKELYIEDIEKSILTPLITIVHSIKKQKESILLEEYLMNNLLIPNINKLRASVEDTIQNKIEAVYLKNEYKSNRYNSPHLLGNISLN